MIHLLYMSQATNPMTELQLYDLLLKAREHNLRNDITGVLLYKEGYFMQLLEGFASNVDELYGRIQLDRRHHTVITLLRRRIESKVFASWSMGFVNMEKVSLGQDFQHYCDALKGFSQFEENANNAYQLINSFEQPDHLQALPQ